jgi:hypothetical protein
MSVIGRLFKRREKPPAHFLVAQLNARLQPVDRSEHFEEGLDDKLRKLKLGEISGGGTMQSETGEIAFCDIEIKLRQSSPEAERVVIETLESLGAPKGSKLEIGGEDRIVSFGVNEGLAVYLNGTDLPAETYRSHTLESIEDEFERLLDGQGHVFSHWKGPTETAVYVYGPSFAEMSKRLEPCLRTNPLCEKCRVEQIA